MRPNDAVSQAMYPLGLVIAAPLITGFGVRPLLSAGGGCLLSPGLFAFIPIVRNLESSLDRRKKAPEVEEVAG